MASSIATATLRKRSSTQDWRFVLGMFCITSLVEAYCVSQVFNFLLPYLLHMGVREADAKVWVGILSSLNFAIGLPLVPLWGVWADKYSRKAIIIRSALVEAVVFTLVGLSTTPLQLAGSMMLVGLQLGNTGVMLSALRDLAPGKRLGLGIAIFGAMSPLGFAVGPIAGGFLLDGLHISFTQNYFITAALSILVAVMLGLGFREVRPKHVPEGPVLKLAYGVVASVLRVRSTRRIFGAFGLGFFGYEAVITYLPALVLQIYGNQPGHNAAIGWVAGGASLLGAVLSPFGGALGDRFGYRNVLVVASLLAAVTLALMPFTGGLVLLFAASVVFGACTAVFIAMVFALLATQTPEESRSSTLNLVYLPIYVAGIVGPIAAGLIVQATGNLALVFLIAAALFGLALVPLRSEKALSMTVPSHEENPALNSDPETHF